MANTDALTGLANRRRMGETLSEEMARFYLHGNPYSLILIDVDHFKSINDQWGHEVGDRVLVSLASRLHESLRETEVVARWGGEEFMILVPHTSHERVDALAQRLRRNIADLPLEGLAVTISCGVSTVLREDQIEDVIGRADWALYLAKSAGRNRVVAVLGRASVEEMDGLSASSS